MVAVPHTTVVPLGTTVDSFVELRKWIVAFIEMKGNPEHLEIYKITEERFSDSDVQGNKHAFSLGTQK
jgi:hypothetical protein